MPISDLTKYVPKLSTILEADVDDKFYIADEKAHKIIDQALQRISSMGTASAFPTGKSDPVILDESIKFTVDDKGKNPDVTAGQVLVHGAVYESLLVGCTAAFKGYLP